MKADYEFAPSAKCVKPAKCQRTYCQRILSWLKMSDKEEPWTREWGGYKRGKLRHMCLCESDIAEHLSPLWRIWLNHCFTVSTACLRWIHVHFEHLDLCFPMDQTLEDKQCTVGNNIPMVRYQTSTKSKCHCNFVMAKKIDWPFKC